MLRHLSKLIKSTSNVQYSSMIRSTIPFQMVGQGKLRFFSNKSSEKKSNYDPNQSYLSLFKLIWRNARSDLPVRSAMRKYSKEETWGIITWDGDTFHHSISTKVDPELGEIARSIVAKAKYLSNIERKGLFSCILHDKMFHDEMTNLQSQWKARLKILFQDRVISENKIENPISDEDISIYNIHLIIKKYHHDLYKLLGPEISTENSSYLLP